MTSRRHKSRELAMQVLFMWDTAGAADAEAAQAAVADEGDDPSRRRALEMARAAWDMRQTADRWIERLAPQWPPRRQPAVDRNVLRLAVYELMSLATPPKVVIDEAIELAKEFSTEQSAAFVNGVLDSILREKAKLLEEGPILQSASADLPPQADFSPQAQLPPQADHPSDAARPSDTARTLADENGASPGDPVAADALPADPVAPNPASTDHA